jgi:lauroyl/myristoyl acyltransferase
VDGTRCVISEIEKIVRQNPDQWLWMHRRWRRSDERDAGAQNRAVSNPDSEHRRDD